MSYIIFSNRTWFDQEFKSLENKYPGRVHYYKEKSFVSKEFLEKLKPKFIFFPFWSHKIPSEVFNAYRTIIFHMTDLPFGRGGSPLQNLIARGIYQTKICAVSCQEELDSGDVYLRRAFSLEEGSAREIYIRASSQIREMIEEIINNAIEPIPQQGEAIYFHRRKPQDSAIGDIKNLRAFYDHIRMLDADGYPKAYLNFGKYRLEFDRAEMKDGLLRAHVLIKEENEDG